MNHTRSLIALWRRGYRTLFAILVSIGISCNVLASEAADREQVFEEAKSFLRDGKAQAAYALLIDHEEEWSGNDAYDYLLGVAALDSNNAGEAIFSLQRLVVRKPDFSGARLELARAYFALGDNELARVEFERLLQEDPPRKVRDAVASYIAAINARAQSYTASTRYFVDVGLGYDSNAPASTDDSQFLTFTLSPNNLEQDSAFAEVTVGSSWNRPLSPESQLLINGSLMGRSNGSTHFVDPGVANLGLAWVWRNSTQMVNIGGTASASKLDGQSNKQQYAFNGSYQYKMSDTWRFSGLLRYGALRFEDLLEVQDVNQFMFGMGVEQQSPKSVLNVALLGTSDAEQERGSNFGNEGFGVQVSNTWFSSTGNRLFAMLSASTTEYDKAFFGRDRDDDLYGFTLAHTWNRFPYRDWNLTFQVNYSQKQSTVGLYEYDRWEAGLFIRKVFN
jgi:tetratricopeptide (TPR) repeat protein